MTEAKETQKDNSDNLNEWKSVPWSAAVNGTSLQGYCETSFATLKDLFGEHCASDGYKVSTEWVVSNGKHVVTIYDYKETRLYDRRLPTVDQFRQQTSHQWHLGAKSQNVVESFLAFLALKGIQGQVGLMW
jgi:hypothetical protein